MAMNMRAVIFLVFTIFTLYVISRTVREVMPIPWIPRFGKISWQELAAEKKQCTMAKIPNGWILDPTVLEEGKKRRKIAGDFIESLLDLESLEITSLDNVEIVEATSNGSLSAFQVTAAFCKRAAYAHQLNQNLLDIGFDIALQRAKELDQYYAEHHKPIGPLHGLPVSMKDQYHIKGLETTMAYVGWIGTFEGKKGTGKERNFESELVRELYSLGAIPFVKTTLVQSLWSGETNNNILGYTWNPHNHHLSVGGSSGGEGAIGALRGSAFGIGSDIGGSISMPAVYNGLYSIKPSSGRLPFKNVASGSAGQAVIPTVVGVLGPSVQSMRLVFKSLLSTCPWLHDPDVIPLPWRDEAEYTFGKQEKANEVAIGLFENDGIVSPHPPIARALRIVAEALKADKHKVVRWQPPSHAIAAKIHPTIARGDSSPDVLENIALSGEPFVPEIQSLFPNGRLRDPISLLEFENATLDMKNFRKQYQEYWDSTADMTDTNRPVDAVILPVVPHTAPLPKTAYWYTYISVVNVLDYPTVVIPVTTADAEIDEFDPNYKPVSEKDKLNWKSYDPEKYDGAPAGIQILGRRLEEEKLLSIAQVVVDALAKYNKISK